MIPRLASASVSALALRRTAVPAPLPARTLRAQRGVADAAAGAALVVGAGEPVLGALLLVVVGLGALSLRDHRTRAQLLRERQEREREELARSANSGVPLTAAELRQLDEKVAKVESGVEVR
ncbi:hypothetical protein M427DRAFT_136415 [Gonapodya prolifera JEL478]|uniref:Uncharacterized protein n=1 Tax=Gonapodya prolifera (strain JEL478) TaxID=1344416 RepID=A0A139AA80_GONPJ|nr:hypothetical protein M427DRAFT_136415 [Gonapodya prolifera JEL478]|eukprot:KXS13637.1 hypothetical protein M427DRAFT_136415 [Gonapodya prolifera JEL478]